MVSAEKKRNPKHSILRGLVLNMHSMHFNCMIDVFQCNKTSAEHSCRFRQVLDSLEGVASRGITRTISDNVVALSPLEAKLKSRAFVCQKTEEQLHCTHLLYAMTFNTGTCRFDVRTARSDDALNNGKTQVFQRMSDSRR